MRIAILADIHANLEALTAVSRELEGQAVDRVISLGDNIGYGPDPEAVILHLRTSGYESVLGNHEYALFDERARKWLNFQAAENNVRTAALLSGNNLLYLKNLPFFLEIDNGYWVHGFPPESVFRYLHRQSTERLGKLFAGRPGTIYFVGHTHKLRRIVGCAGKITVDNLEQGKTSLEAGCSYIFNCGAVGQPRDGDSRAKYLIWDQEEMTVETCFTPYDNWLTKQKIQHLGFPEIYGLRLG